MKASIPKAELLHVIEITERAVNTKSSLPILGALLLTVDGAGLTALATDLEMTLEATGCLAEPGVNGKVAVIADTFVPIVKTLPGDVIDLETTKEGLLVKSRRSKYKVPVISGEQWPVLPAVTSEKLYTVREDLLKLTLEKVLGAAGNDSTRPQLMGALWRFQEEGLLLVATDTHRLHVSRCKLDGYSGPADILVGSRPCRELVRFLDGEGFATLTTDGICLRITCWWGQMTARLTNGVFPSYERYIPDHETYLKLDKKEFAEALKRAAIVAAGCADRVEIRHGGSLDIYATGADSIAEESVALIDGNCGAGRFAVSVRNLLGAVAAVPDEVVTLRKGDGMRPIVVSGECPDRYFGAVTPMRLPDEAV